MGCSFPLARDVTRWRLEQEGTLIGPTDVAKDKPGQHSGTMAALSQSIRGIRSVNGTDTYKHSNRFYFGFLGESGRASTTFSRGELVSFSPVSLRAPVSLPRIES